MQSAIVVDDRGRSWSLASPHLERHLQTTLAGPRLARYLVSNLGFVLIDPRSNFARIRLRPAIASAVAVATTVTWLMQREDDRIVIAHQDDGSQDEIVGAPHVAIQRLAELMTAVHDRRAEAFFRTQLEPHLLGTKNPLGELMTCWREERERANPFTVAQRFGAALSDRYAIIEAKKGGRNMLIRRFGAGYQTFDAAWRSQAAGMRFEDQPDVHFARWTAKAYYEVLESGWPALDAIDVVVSRPMRGRTRSDYTRLILPFRGAKGDIALLTASTAGLPMHLRDKRRVERGQIA